MRSFVPLADSNLPRRGIAMQWYHSIAPMRAEFKECRPASLFFRHRLLQMVYRAEYFVKFISLMQSYLFIFLAFPFVFSFIFD